MHALIIEDDFLIAGCIENLLLELGFDTVAIAASEADALRSAACRPPDLITSDVQLDEGDGIATVAAILQSHPVPVVFVTSVRDEVQRRLPALPIMAKPFSPLALRRFLGTHLGI